MVDPVSGQVECTTPDNRITAAERESVRFDVLDSSVTISDEGIDDGFYSTALFGIDAFATNHCVQADVIEDFDIPIPSFAVLNIDYEGELGIIASKTDDKTGLSVSYSGKLDDFPAYETYVRINRGLSSERVVQMFAVHSGADGTAEELFFDANNDFSVSAVFSNQGTIA